MGKAKQQKHTWICYRGEWYNFNEYQKFDRFGGKIIVVRGPTKKGDFTKKTTTKFVEEKNGDYRFINPEKEKVWEREKGQVPKWQRCWREYMNVWRSYHGNV